jgi:hypothetical protein
LIGGVGMLLSAISNIFNVFRIVAHKPQVIST